MPGWGVVRTIDVACQPTAGGWACRVCVDDGRGRTEHDVGVRTEDLDRFDPGSSDPSDLVRRSFDFLLEREPKESILRSFDLPVIASYFPEFEARIRRSRP
jgi:hypothetical protein